MLTNSVGSSMGFVNLTGPIRQVSGFASTQDPGDFVKNQADAYIYDRIGDQTQNPLQKGLLKLAALKSRLDSMGGIVRY